MRAADQPVQREDLPVPVVLDGARGGRDVHLDAVVAASHRHSQRSSSVRATLRQPRRQTQGLHDSVMLDLGLDTCGLVNVTGLTLVPPSPCVSLLTSVV